MQLNKTTVLGKIVSGALAALALSAFSAQAEPEVTLRLHHLLGPKAPPAAAVDLRSSLDDAAPLLHSLSRTSALLRAAPPLCVASVLSFLRDLRLKFSLYIETTGSHVPHKSLC